MTQSDGLTDELLLLIAFLLTSAHGLGHEPKSYGPARLLEAAGRLLEIMDEHCILDNLLQEIREAINRERFSPWDEGESFARLDELALRWTELVAERMQR